ncbi:hypothetical protein GCM10023220_25190 [Streptomyces ziwulingensis]|uniref:Uncharacterized protein n=1 Tax=Streptomyces ziwulingensis TaxID=1045501 RepID=A0ABP9BLD7_9ACTN
MPGSEESSAAKTRAGIRCIPASTSCAAKPSTNLDTATGSRRRGRAASGDSAGSAGLAGPAALAVSFGSVIGRSSLTAGPAQSCPSCPMPVLTILIVSYIHKVLK